MRIYLLAILLISPSIFASDFSLLKKYTDTMKPGEWLELPATQIPLYTKEEIVKIQEMHGGANIWGNSGSTSVINTWTGSAFDGHRWWFFGGGHADYGGNEVYQFDFTTLKWERLTSPSPLTKTTGSTAPGKTCPMPENGPSAAHTYDGFTWNPVSKTIWLTAQTGYCLTGYYNNPERPFWEFNPATKVWKQHESFGVKTGYVLSAWSPESKRIVVIPKHYNAVAAGPFEIDEMGVIHRRNNKSFGISVGNLSYDSDNNVMLAIEATKLKEQLLKGDPLPVWTTKSAIPQEWIDWRLDEAGVVYHPPTKSMIYWNGYRDIWVYKTDTKEFHKISNANSKAAPTTKHKAVYSKWVYLPELDVFAGYMNTEHGIWLYKLGELGTNVLDKDRACIKATCYTSIAKAFKALTDGDTITLSPGEWHDGGTITANNVTVLASGAILTKGMSGKGAIITKGDNITIEGLECKNIAVSGGNGACIRIEGRDVVLKNLYVHDCQQGLLSNSTVGTVTLEDSLFENNGKESGRLGNQHGIYIAGDKLIVRRTTIRSNFNQGHELKSRAKETLIEDSIIISNTGIDSRTIDIPNGGIVNITNSILQHGIKSVNNNFIGYGHEGSLFDKNSFNITGSTIISDSPANKHVLFAKSTAMPDPVFKNNVIVGQYASDISNKDDNCYFANRSDAGLPVYPDFDFALLKCSK